MRPAAELDEPRASWVPRHPRGGIGRCTRPPTSSSACKQLLDASAAAAGPHLRGIISEDRRVDAVALCQRLQGMCLLVLATATADGRPLAGPVDGYFLHGTFFFSSGRNSVRMRHLAARPAVSATYLPGEEFAVTVHGRAELFDVLDPRTASSGRPCSTSTYRSRGRRSRPGWQNENPLGRGSRRRRCSPSAWAE